MSNTQDLPLTHTYLMLFQQRVMRWVSMVYAFVLNPKFTILLFILRSHDLFDNVFDHSLVLFLVIMFGKCTSVIYVREMSQRCCVIILEIITSVNCVTVMFQCCFCYLVREVCVFFILLSRNVRLLLFVIMPEKKYQCFLC